jgi:lipopolysaccharide export system permease protein
MRAVLDRYVISECLPTLGLSLSTFAFVLLMQRLLRLSDLVVAKGVPLIEVVRLLMLALPALLPLLLPVSLLLAVLLAMARLSADSEIIAMRACGVGLARNIRPVLALSSVVFVAAAVLSLWAQPVAARSFRSALYESIKSRLSVMTEEGVFTELSPGVTVYAERIDSDSGLLRNLFLHMESGSTRGAWIFAELGEIREVPAGLELVLSRGELHQRLGPDKPYRRLRFDTSRQVVPLPSATAESFEIEEASSRDLARKATSPPYDRAARMELHRRLAIPASCLIFGVLGVSLGVHHARSGKSRGIVVCIVVLFAYYALLTAGKALGHKGALPPELAMWLPDLALGGFAAYAFVRKNREAPLPLEEALARAFRRARRRVFARSTP